MSENLTNDNTINEVQLDRENILLSDILTQLHLFSPIPSSKNSPSSHPAPKNISTPKWDEYCHVAYITYTKNGMEGLNKWLCSKNFNETQQADIYTQVAREMKNANRVESANLARKAWLTDPRLFRLKWYAFSLFHAGKIVEANLLLELMGNRIDLSESEKSALEKIKKQIANLPSGGKQSAKPSTQSSSSIYKDYFSPLSQNKVLRQLLSELVGQLDLQITAKKAPLTAVNQINNLLLKVLPEKRNFTKALTLYTSGGSDKLRLYLNNSYMKPKGKAEALTHIARQIQKSDPASSSTLALQAYAHHPHSYRLKWYAFRLMDAGQNEQAFAILDFLNTNVEFSESEKKRIEKMRQNTHIINNKQENKAGNAMSETQDKYIINVKTAGGMGDSCVILSFLKQIYLMSQRKIYFRIYGQPEKIRDLCVLLPFIESIHEREEYDELNADEYKIFISHWVIINNIPSHAQTTFPFIYDIAQKIIQKNKEYRHYIGNAPLFDNQWADYCVKVGLNRWAELDYDGLFDLRKNSQFGLNLDLQKMTELAKRFDLRQKYIVVHNGHEKYTEDHNYYPKMWDPENFKKFISLYKAKYPEIKIFQVGNESDEPIPGVDYVLNGKVSFAESYILLKNALFLVSDEGGLVHAMHQLSGKSIVLFGPTPEPYYGFPENINIVSDFCVNCWWLTREWRQQCPRGFEKAKCMEMIKAEPVFEEACKLTDNLPSYKYFISDVNIYSSKGREKFQSYITDICKAFNIEQKPISDFIYGRCRTYIHASKQWEYPYAIDVIQKFANGKKLKIADVGGGRGLLSLYLSKLGHDVSLYDINFDWDNRGNQDLELEFIHYARENGVNVDFGSIFNIPAPDNYFDVVTCISVVEHVTCKFFAIKEMLRVIKPGGKLILTYDLRKRDSDLSSLTSDEIFSTDMIREVLNDIDIHIGDIYSEESVERSIAERIGDKVKMARPITVGALVINKI